MTPRRIRGRAAGLLCAALILACSDATPPTAPETGAPSSAAPVAAIEPVRAVGAAAAAAPVAARAASALEDAAERIAVTLPHLAVSTRLRRSLQQLAGALDSPARAQVEQLLEEADRALGDLGTRPGSSGLGPELSAIELALEAAQREIAASRTP